MTDEKEPDLEGYCDEIVSIKRIPSMNKHPPQIAWGAEYRKWPIGKRLSYAERLASSMNHAADVLQQERKALSDICKQMEQQIKAHIQRYAEQGALMTRQVNKANEEKQELYQESEILHARIRELENVGDHS